MEHFEAKQAQAFLRENADAPFIDCRSEMEYLFVGHPVGALHVPWNDGFEGKLNERRQRNSLTGWRHTGLPWEQC